MIQEEYIELNNSDNEATSKEEVVFAMIHYLRRTKSTIKKALDLFEITEKEYNRLKNSYRTKK